MPSTSALKDTDPHDIFVIEPDVVLAARAEPAPSPANDSVSPPSASPASILPEDSAGTSAPSVDTTFRAVATEKAGVEARSSSGRRARRAAMLFVLTLCGVAAVAGWKQYGSTAKALAANWMPALALGSPPPEQKGDAAGQAALPVQQAKATVQPVAPALPAPNAVQPVAVLPAETAQLLQSMSQQIAELKTSVEQLKAGQTQMSRDMARTTEARSSDNRPAETAKPATTRMAEPNLRPKLPAPVHRPKPAYVPVQAAVAPPLPPPTPAPVTLQPPSVAPPPAEYTAQSEYGPVVRPPLPLR